LQQKSLKKHEHLIKFAKAVKELDKMLAAEAKGFGLEDLYQKVPEILKGYVELFYDRNNNPGFRFFESLLYQSEFYNKGSQSIGLWLTHNDERPFVLSTPRLDEPNVISLDIPFDYPGIDELAKMKRTPQTLGYIKAMLGIPASKKRCLKLSLRRHLHRCMNVIPETRSGCAILAMPASWWKQKTSAYWLIP
jgi:hypothetical protein